MHRGIKVFLLRLSIWVRYEFLNLVLDIELVGDIYLLKYAIHGKEWEVVGALYGLLCLLSSTKLCYLGSQLIVNSQVGETSQLQYCVLH